MKKTLYLAKILRQCGNGLAGSDYEKTRKQTNIAVGILGLGLAVGLFFLGMNLINLEPVLGDPYIILSCLFLLGTIVNVVFEIPGLIENLYMGQDNYTLLALPFTPMQIVLARVISSAGFPACVAAVCVFPAGIGFMVKVGVSFSIILTLIVAFISILFISMSFDVAIVIVIISIVKGFRNRDSLKIVGAFLLLVLLTLWIILANTGINQDTLIMLSEKMSKVLWILPVNFALQEMFNGIIWLPLLEALGITIGFVLLALIIAKFMYLNGVLKMQDTSNTGGIVDEKEYSKLSKKTSNVLLIAKRDYYLTSRNPAHFTNSYLFPLVIPIVIVAAMFISSMSTFLTSMPIDSNTGSIFMVSYIVPFMTVMGTALGALSYTCISREGSSFDMLRILPIPFETIIKGKELLAFLFNAVPMVILSVIGCLVGVIGFGMKAWAIPYAIVYCFFLSMFSIDRNMIRDMKSPNLVWDNEGLMIKNAGGIRSVLIMLLGMLFSIISVIVCMTKIFAPFLIPFNIIVTGVMALTAHSGLKKWSKKVGEHLNM